MRFFLIFILISFIENATTENENEETKILKNFFQKCSDASSTMNHIQRNIESLLYAKIIAETAHDSNIFLQVCANQTLTFCVHCSSMCKIDQYCSSDGDICRTNCISNRVNLHLSYDCCSKYCNRDCPTFATTNKARSVRSAEVPGNNMNYGLIGLAILFPVLVFFILFRQPKWISCPCARVGNRHAKYKKRQKISSIEPAQVSLVDKFEGKWDLTDEETYENYPRAPVADVVYLSHSKSELGGHEIVSEADSDSDTRFFETSDTLNLDTTLMK